MRMVSELYESDLSAACKADLPWEKLNDKTVLITGAAGLIAACLIDLLVQKNKEAGMNIKILAAVRSQKRAERCFSEYLSMPCFQLIEQDVTEPWRGAIVPDFIIHAASNAHPLAFSKDPVGTMNANYIGVANLLELARKTNAKVLYLSSGEVYGLNNGIDIFRETDCGPIDLLSPRSCYPSSKRAAETLCSAYHAQYGVDTVIARPCHIYGPTMTDSDSRVIAQFIRNALKGEDIVMKSAGTQQRSMCYAVDCATALLTVLLKGNIVEAYNISDAESKITIAELAKLIAEKADVKVRFEIPDAIESAGYNKVEHSVLSGEKLSALGWSPSVTLDEGIGRTIEILKAVKEW